MSRIANYVYLLSENKPVLYCKPAYEGPQIFLSWTLPDPNTFDDVVLVRREKKFPQNLSDGTHILSTTSGTFWHDINNLNGETFYYYTLFTRTSGHAEFDSNSQAYTAALNTNHFKTWLYNHVPPEWRQLDRLVSIDEGQVQNLVQIQSGIYGEYFNLGEDGSNQYYTLERFLRNIGIQLDRTYSLIKLSDKTMNINDMPADFIQSFADLVKINVGFIRDIATKRFKVRSATAYWGKKGTIDGILSLIEDIFNHNLEFELDEKFDNVLNVSDLNSSIINLSEYHKYYNTSSGTEDFIIQLSNIGRTIGYDRFIIYLRQSGLENLTEEPNIVFDRLIDELKEYIPVNTSFLVDFKDYYVAETADLFSAQFSGLTDLYDS